MCLYVVCVCVCVYIILKFLNVICILADPLGWQHRLTIPCSLPGLEFVCAFRGSWGWCLNKTKALREKGPKCLRVLEVPSPLIPLFFPGSAVDVLSVPSLSFQSYYGQVEVRVESDGLECSCIYLHQNLLRYFLVFCHHRTVQSDSSRIALLQLKGLLLCYVFFLQCSRTSRGNFRCSPRLLLRICLHRIAMTAASVLVFDHQNGMRNNSKFG